MYHLSQTLIAILTNNNEVLFLAVHQKEKNVTVRHSQGDRAASYQKINHSCFHPPCLSPSHISMEYICCHDLMWRKHQQYFIYKVKL